MPNQQLRVTAVTIKNVLGAKSFAMEPGPGGVILTGANGSGKSTALDALRAALNGGNLARLAHVGSEDDPEVVLVLEGDGSEFYRVERKGDKVRVRSRVGDSAALEDLGKPQSWLKSLFDADGSNPVTFLMAKDKERALMLLEALPLEMDRPAFEAILAKTDGLLDRPKVPSFGLHPLQEVAFYRNAIFSARTGVNRDAKGKAASADQVRRASPAVIPDDPVLTITQHESAVAAMAKDLGIRETEIRAEEERAVTAAQADFTLKDSNVRADHKEAVRKLRADHEVQAAEIRRQAEAEIARLLAVVEETVSERREKTDEALSAASEVLSQAKADARAAAEAAEKALEPTRKAITDARESLVALREQAKEHERAKTLHAQAKKFDDEAEQLVANSAVLTETLDALDAFQRRLAKDLPIEGLEIDGEEIKVFGIPYAQLNTQQRVDISVEVACLRKGRLPVVWVDGAETLDTPHFLALVARLKAKGVQAFVGRVADHDLRVEAIA